MGTNQTKVGQEFIVKNSVGQNRKFAKSRIAVTPDLPQKRQAKRRGTISVIEQNDTLLNSNHMSMYSLAEFEDIGDEFSAEEIVQLRLSFEKLKRNRDDVAKKLLACVMTVPEAMESYQNATPDVGNSWMALHQGMMLMSGIERLLLRIDNSKSLTTAVQRLKFIHQMKYKVTSDVMAKGLKACESEFLEAVKEAVDEGKEKQTESSSKICQTWTKFFAIVIKLISSQNTEPVKPIKQCQQPVPGRKVLLSTPNIISLEDIEDVFSEEEVTQLRLSFETLKKNRDDVAKNLLSCVMTVPEAMETYQKATLDVDNSWMANHLGMMLMSGIERLLLRIDKTKNLIAAIRRQTIHHQLKFSISPGLMAKAFKASRPGLLEELKKVHSENIEEYDETWIKFFAVVEMLFLSEITK